MAEGKYVITAINKLSGMREEISGPMDEASARQRLERESLSWGKQRYQPYARMRVEKRLPVQLRLIFNDCQKND